MGRKGLLLGSGSGSDGRAAQTQGTGECVVHEVVLSQEGKADGRDGRWSTAGLYCKLMGQRPGLEHGAMPLNTHPWSALNHADLPALAVM
jgi:hypothetical protein